MITGISPQTFRRIQFSVYEDAYPAVCQATALFTALALGCRVHQVKNSGAGVRLDEETNIG